MLQYLKLVNEVLTQGDRKPTRAKLSDGQHVGARSIFGRTLRFNLAEGLPLVTTRRIAWKIAVHELVWMLRGETNVRYLHEHGVHIWDRWADANGDLGPLYGKQLRRWQGPTGEIDQVAQLLADIEAVKRDPTAAPGRRLILSMWNVGELAQMALPPCPLLCQFNVTKGNLSCLVYQRSADLFLGLPFDLTVYAVLTHLIARVAHLGVGELIFSIGDAHVYDNHVEQAREQTRRLPKERPTLHLAPTFLDLDTLTADMVSVVGYEHHTALAGEVAV